MPQQAITFDQPSQSGIAVLEEGEWERWGGGGEGEREERRADKERGKWREGGREAQTPVFTLLNAIGYLEGHLA